MRESQHTHYLDRGLHTMKRYQVEAVASLSRLGITAADITALRRIAGKLDRWHTRECNGEVCVEDDGKAYLYNTYTGSMVCQVANQERIALGRLETVMGRYPDLAAYVQGDPRGCPLYVYRPAELGERDIDTCYPSVGVPVQ